MRRDLFKSIDSERYNTPDGPLVIYTEVGTSNSSGIEDIYRRIVENMLDGLIDGTEDELIKSVISEVKQEVIVPEREDYSFDRIEYAVYLLNEGLNLGHDSPINLVLNFEGEIPEGDAKRINVPLRSSTFPVSVKIMCDDWPTFGLPSDSNGVNGIMEGQDYSKMKLFK